MTFDQCSSKPPARHGAMDNNVRIGNGLAFADIKARLGRRFIAIAAIVAAALMLFAGAIAVSDSDDSSAAAGNTFTAANGDGISIEYKILTEGGSTGTVQVGSGSDTAITDTTSGALNIPGTVTNGGITYEVTIINDDAFYDCDALTSVTMPNSLTAIGDEAFYGCDALTSITIPDSVTAIDDGAFSGCGALTSITVGTSNANYSSDAQGALYNKNKTELIQCSGGYSGPFTVPNSVTTIVSGAFAECSALTSISINNSSTNYSSDAQGALYNKNKTTLMQCPGGYSGPFTVPNTVTSIGDYAFSGCRALTSITVNDANANYSSDAQGALYNKNKTTLIQSSGGFSGSFAVPNTVTTIGEWAFVDCDSLTSITIPNSVTTIGEYAFGDCNSLTSITIPNSVTTIGEYAFYGCSTLTAVTIGSGVTDIGDEAFEHGFRDSSGNTITQASQIAGHSYVLNGDYFVNTAPDDGFPILYVAIGLIAGIAIVGGAAFYLYRKKGIA